MEIYDSENENSKSSFNVIRPTWGSLKKNNDTLNKAMKPIKNCFSIVRQLSERRCALRMQQKMESDFLGNGE
jgi:hypothetical protein